MVDATVAQSSHPQLTSLADLQWKWNLLRAAEEGTLEDVKSLFEVTTPFRKDPDLVDDTGCSALMNAALTGKLDIVKYLVEEQHADINLCDKEGFAASTIAAYMGHTEILRYLLRHRSYRPPPTRHTPLIAAASCHLPTVQMLVEEFKHDVNESGPKGFTPIMMAAQAGRLEIVRYLTRMGADLDIRNDQWFRVFDIVPSTIETHLEKGVAAAAPATLFLTQSSSTPPRPPPLPLLILPLLPHLHQSHCHFPRHHLLHCRLSPRLRSFSALACLSIRSCARSAANSIGCAKTPPKNLPCWFR